MRVEKMENDNKVNENTSPESNSTKETGGNSFRKLRVIAIITLVGAIFVLAVQELSEGSVSKSISNSGTPLCDSEDHIMNIPGRYNHTNIVEIKKGPNYRICSLRNQYGMNYTYRVSKTVDGEPYVAWQPGLVPSSRLE
jgi:hypothetical protein